jgi:hypothetical protein
MALAHVAAVEVVYRRGDLFEKRRPARRCMGAIL